MVWENLFEYLLLFFLRNGFQVRLNEARPMLIGAKFDNMSKYVLECAVSAKYLSKSEIRLL